MELLKVGRNDGDGERENEDPGHGAHAPEELAQARGGGDVAVPHRGHGHHEEIDTLPITQVMHIGKVGKVARVLKL